MTVRVPNTMHPGTIQIPPSKSFAQRYILAASLSTQATTLMNIGDSEDVKSMLDMIMLLGSEITVEKKGVHISPGIKKSKAPFDCGESGLGARLIIPVLAALGGSYRVEGKGSLLQRPLNDLVDFLRQHGVQVKSDSGFLPFDLDGKLTGSTFEINGRASSQNVSGLLMALPLLKNDSELLVPDLVSKPYVNMTLDVLNNFGIGIKREGIGHFKISGNQTYQSNSPSFEIEGDYSGAANWVVFGAISKEPVFITGLKKNSLQGDSRILEAVEKSGAKIVWQKDVLSIQKSEHRPFQFDASETPDLFPPLVVLAAAANGISTITGASRLIHKESNRALTLQTEFKKLGLKIVVSDDVMTIFGQGVLKPGTISSNNDHRIAMAGAIAAILTPESVTIENAEAVNKSYPRFWTNCAIN